MILEVWLQETMLATKLHGLYIKKLDTQIYLERHQHATDQLLALLVAVVWVCFQKESDLQILQNTATEGVAGTNR
jgi:hypothetical protein